MGKLLLQLLPKTRENVELAPYTTFKIGGPARYFFVAENEEDIVRAVRAAQESQTPFFILGGGSNLLISDKGFNGLVIKIQNTRYKIQDTELAADAGVSMSTLVSETTQRGLGGLEWAGGLPGTLGGAVRGNAGAFKGEIKDSIESVRTVDPYGVIKNFSLKECEFSYRSSVFKKENCIVLSATIRLVAQDKEKIIAEAEDHIRYRNERHPLEYPNAGSVFKNCDLVMFKENERSKYDNVVKVDPFPVVPTAYLLSEAKLKGLAHGGAAISEKHPNFIVNKNNASSDDIIQLMGIARDRIREKFYIDLESEVQLVGFN